jgi:hypothetical protein
MEKTTSKTPTTRSPDAVEQDVVDLPRALNRKGSTVAGVAAYLSSPGVSAGCVAHHRQRKRRGGGTVGLLMKEERNGIEAGAMRGADLSYGPA